MTGTSPLGRADRRYGAPLAWLVLAALLVATGCDQATVRSPSPSPSTEGTAASVSAFPSASTSVAPGEPTAGPPFFSGPVTCGDDQAFAADLLFAAGNAEADPDPGAGALREFLAGADGAGMPRTGWVRVADAPGRVQFIARADDADAWLVAGFFELNGTWQLDLAGQCAAHPVVPAGIGLATWWLDPALARPTPVDTTVHALIVERACASGRAPEGRVREPQVFEDDTWVVVLVTVTNLPGGADCPGNPTFPIAITLPSPLGDRRLYDGSAIPARDATIPDS